MALLLVCVLGLLLFSSCETQKQMAYEKVMAYLNEKHPGYQFTVNGFTQDTETSGKYTFYVTCINTGVDFEVVSTTLFSSDSFTVCHANAEKKKDLYGIFGESALSRLRIADIQCHDLYLDGGGTYRFNEDEELLMSHAKHLDEIYRVTFSDVASADDAVQRIWMFCDILYSGGTEANSICLDKVSFEFTLGKETIRVETNTASIDPLLDFTDLIRRIEQAQASTAEMNTPFYKDADSGVKIIQYYREYIEKD